VAHAAYVLLVRPYIDRLEQVFASVLALGQALLGVTMAVAAIRNTGHVTTGESRGAVVAGAWLIVALNVVFYVQVVALAVWEARRLYLRLRTAGDDPGPRQRPSWRPVAGESDGTAGALAVPMLQRNATTGGRSHSPTHRSEGDEGGGTPRGSTGAGTPPRATGTPTGGRRPATLDSPRANPLRRPSVATPQ
jgi:hypothetical protein